MKLRRRSGITALLVSGLLLSLLAPIAGAQERPADREERIRSGIDQAIARVQDALLEQVEEASTDETLLVVVRMEEGTDLSPFTEGAPLVRPAIESLGITAAVARVKASNVVKLASVEGVQFVQLPESMATPPEPPDPDVGTYAPSFDLFVERLRGIYGEGAPEADDGGAGAEPTGWFDVRADAGHRSAAAWEKGYTGEGVKVMVNDSGIDFAHPDLQGTWATVPDGPLAGWPLMFDSYSLFVYVLDNFFGTTSVTDGQTDYVDTSHECARRGRGAVVMCPFAPLGGKSHAYKVPNTSESGVYRLGSHPDKTLATFWAQVLSPGPQVNAGERAAVLLVDENEAGVYDTVYVDLNYNFDFTDEKPATKADPVLYRDGMTIHLPPASGDGRGEPTAIEVPADGYADISGGLVYFIADGSTPLPGSYLWGGFAPAPADGDLVAFALNDPLEAAGDHGQLTASNVAAQGVINGAFGAGAERPAYKPDGAGGMVQGAGKDAKLVNNGNFYLSPFLEDGMLFSALGYDGVAGTADDTQIVSNSWGCSAVDNDGWDTACGSRLFEFIMEFVSDGTMTTTISTGNGGPGFGTLAPPAAPSQISVGASTQMGSTGWDSAEDLDQITWGDIIPFSNRGPSALGNVGTHVVADGAFASGALSLNEWGDGWTAYTTWGGTSRSAPVAAGNLALVYDAFHQANGEWPTRHEARAIFMHGADNIHYDVLTQGGGLVNADRATDIAAGDGFFVTPDNWQVGDYRGDEFPAFANIIAPGGSDSQVFDVSEADSVDLRAVTLSRIDEVVFDFTSTAQGAEDPYNFNRPGYLLEITNDIPEGTDLMVVRAIYPYDQWDVNQDYRQDNVWRLLAYDWKDQDGDGELWSDDDGNGTVNGAELDNGEYMRYAYHHTGQNNKHVFVHDPLQRSHDGVFIGLQHQVRNGPSQTDFSFRVEFYAEQEFDWITVPESASGSFTAEVNVPSDAPLGLHEAAILVSDDAHESVIPVVIDVAADSANFVFGGQEPTDQLYDNSLTYGMQDWTWRAESGDWRFWFTDLPGLDGGGGDSQTVLLVDTQWENGPFTDIDTIVMGPTADVWSGALPGHFGPYTLETIGKSQNTNIGAGTWTFHTATGEARELITVPYVPGLNLVALHTVNYQGASIAEMISGQVGTIEVSPAAITSDSATGTQTVSVTPSVDLSGLVAEGFGLSQPETTTGTVNQDDPDDPSTASFSHTVEISHGAILDVFIDGAAGDDLDLYVYRPDGTLAGSSTTPTADEFVTVQFPEDGTWRIDVHGWSVPGGSTSFELTVDAIQGTQVTTSNVPDEPIAAGDTATFDVNWDGTGLAAGTYDGLVFLGPPEAPGAVRLPVTITVP